MDTNQHDEGDERLVGDLLVGADAIRAYLVLLGMPTVIVWAGSYPDGGRRPRPATDGTETGFGSCSGRGSDVEAAVSAQGSGFQI